MFGSSLPTVVCRRAHVLFTLYMCACFGIVASNTYCGFVLFSSSCVLYVASFSFNGFNRGGVLKETGTTYPSRAPVLVLGFVAHLF